MIKKETGCQIAAGLRVEGLFCNQPRRQNSTVFILILLILTLRVANGACFGV